MKHERNSVILLSRVIVFYVLLQKLSPEQYFQESKFILKSHARQYENELKEEFKSWADEKQLEKVKL